MDTNYITWSYLKRKFINIVKVKIWVWNKNKVFDKYTPFLPILFLALLTIGLILIGISTDSIAPQSTTTSNDSTNNIAVAMSESINTLLSFTLDTIFFVFIIGIGCSIFIRIAKQFV